MNLKKYFPFICLTVFSLNFFFVPLFTYAMQRNLSRYTGGQEKSSPLSLNSSPSPKKPFNIPKRNLSWKKLFGTSNENESMDVSESEFQKLKLNDNISPDEINLPFSVSKKNLSREKLLGTSNESSSNTSSENFSQQEFSLKRLIKVLERFYHITFLKNEKINVYAKEELKENIKNMRLYLSSIKNNQFKDEYYTDEIRKNILKDYQSIGLIEPKNQEEFWSLMTNLMVELRKEKVAFGKITFVLFWMKDSIQNKTKYNINKELEWLDLPSELISLTSFSTDHVIEKWYATNFLYALQNIKDINFKKDFFESGIEKVFKTIINNEYNKRNIPNVMHNLKNLLDLKLWGSSVLIRDSDPKSTIQFLKKNIEFLEEKTEVLEKKFPEKKLLSYESIFFEKKENYQITKKLENYNKSSQAVGESINSFWNNKKKLGRSPSIIKFTA